MFCNSNQTTKEIQAMVCSCSSDGNPTNGNSDNLLHLFQRWKLAAINARLQQRLSANENCNSFERKKTFGRTIFVICSKKSYCVNISQQPKKCFFFPPQHFLTTTICSENLICNTFDFADSIIVIFTALRKLLWIEMPFYCKCYFPIISQFAF